MDTPELEYKPFPKIPRMFREIVITEKIDGTNGSIYITGAGQIFAGSRSRWITPADDNFGFARWVQEHKVELLTLGPGHHFGEWWGSGINRGYGLTHGSRRFSLFNVRKWHEAGESPRIWPAQDPRKTTVTSPAPGCCNVVPILFVGGFLTETVRAVLQRLRDEGSAAQPGFKNPEGVMVFHCAAQSYFKVLAENDEKAKSNG